MRCPICGSTNVKSDRPGEYMCLSCLSFFHESQSSWHGAKKDTTQRRWPADMASGTRRTYRTSASSSSFSSSSSSTRNKASEPVSSSSSSASIIAIIVIVFLAFMGLLGYEYWAKKAKPKIMAQYELPKEKRVAIPPKDTIAKDVFAKQLKQNFTKDLMGIKVGMRWTNMLSLVKKKMTNVLESNPYDELRCAYFNVEREPFPLGAMPKEIKASEGNGKVVKLELKYDEKLEYFVTKNIIPWAGKSYIKYYTKPEFENKVFAIYKWMYKDVEIIYNTNTDVVEIAAQGLDTYALIREKKRQDLDRKLARVRNSSSSRRRQSREEWYDEQEDEEYDDDYDDEYGW